MKRLLIKLLLISTMVFSVIEVHASSTVPSFDLGYAVEGDELVVSFNFSGNPGFSTCNISLVYDSSKLTPSSAAYDTRLGGIFNENLNFSANEVSFVWVNDMSSDATGTGELFFIRFRITDRTSGTGFSLSFVSILNQALSTVPFSYPSALNIPYEVIAEPTLTPSPSPTPAMPTVTPEPTQVLTPSPTAGPTPVPATPIPTPAPTQNPPVTTPIPSQQPPSTLPPASSGTKAEPVPPRQTALTPLPDEESQPAPPAAGNELPPATAELSAEKTYYITNVGNTSGSTVYQYKIIINLPPSLRLVSISDPFGRYTGEDVSPVSGEISWIFQSVPDGFGKQAVIALTFESPDGIFPAVLSGRISFKYPRAFSEVDSAANRETPAVFPPPEISLPGSAPAPQNASLITTTVQQQKTVMENRTVTVREPETKITVPPFSIATISLGLILWLYKAVKKTRRRRMFKRIRSRL
ncbi:MAG: hypothetical protein LBR83_01475 [Clostridiales bacterium]|jgi:hypothetical protein|nr:hypothetical protein [Clostridiales bacterium]